MRPAHTGEVVSRCRAALETSPTGDTGAAGDAAAATALEELHTINETIAANQDNARSPASAILWSIPVVAIAAALITTGVLLLGDGVLPTAAAVLLLIAGVCSGLLSLLYLWSGVTLNSRAARQDALFRAEVGSLLADAVSSLRQLPSSTPPHVASRAGRLIVSCSDASGRSRNELVDDLTTVISVRRAVRETNQNSSGGTRQRPLF
jgi:hypothetical protein